MDNENKGTRQIDLVTLEYEELYVKYIVTDNRSVRLVNKTTTFC